MGKLVEIVIILFNWSFFWYQQQFDLQFIVPKERAFFFQRYLKRKEFEPRKLPEGKIIKRLIYGVKAGKDQSGRALKETAKV